MRSSPLLVAAALSILVAACATATQPPAAPAASAPTAEMAPMPYRAEEIRDASAPGRTYRFRVEAANQPVTIEEITFTTVTETGAEIRSAKFDAKGGPLEPPRTARVAWDELRRHAEFPKQSVTIADERVTVPAGEFDCKVYTVREGDEVTRYYFAKTMPGAPVLIMSDKKGARALTQTLVEHNPGKR